MPDTLDRERSRRPAQFHYKSPGFFPDRLASLNAAHPGAASLCSEIGIGKGVVPTTPGHSSPLPPRKELCDHLIR